MSGRRAFYSKHDWADARNKVKTAPHAVYIWVRLRLDRADMEGGGSAVSGTCGEAVKYEIQRHSKLLINDQRRHTRSLRPSEALP